jgi:hypothetical protein
LVGFQITDKPVQDFPVCFSGIAGKMRSQLAHWICAFPKDLHYEGKSASKGKRLIILHAIMPNGPLCERGDPATNVPYDDLIWNGNVPHPKDFEKREDNKQNTFELLWVSSSSEGDYHDNMNSEM